MARVDNVSQRAGMLVRLGESLGLGEEVEGWGCNISVRAIMQG